MRKYLNLKVKLDFIIMNAYIILSEKTKDVLWILNLCFGFRHPPSRLRIFFIEVFMKLIPLTQGKFAQVDDGDYEWLNQWKWSCCKVLYTYYACRGKSCGNKKQKTVLMHRLINETPKNALTDHRDSNGLNNQKHNLRTCTRSQNGANSKITDGGTSKYKGVCWHKANKKWRAQIRANNRKIHLGLFEKEIDAATAWNVAAIKYHRDFAYLNKI